jgi:hypothetical protein
MAGIIGNNISVSGQNILNQWLINPTSAPSTQSGWNYKKLMYCNIDGCSTFYKNISSVNTPIILPSANAASATIRKVSATISRSRWISSLLMPPRDCILTMPSWRRLLTKEMKRDVGLGEGGQSSQEHGSYIVHLWTGAIGLPWTHRKAGGVGNHLRFSKPGHDWRHQRDNRQGRGKTEVLQAWRLHVI